jgi:hypothetical protein
LEELPENMDVGKRGGHRNETKQLLARNQFKNYMGNSVFS